MKKRWLMSAENRILKNNFMLRGESYKKGMLLLVDYLTPQEWKLGTIFSVRLDSIKTEIEGLYKKYSNNLNRIFSSEEESKHFQRLLPSFEEGNKHFQRLLSSYDSLLAYHTNLPAFQSLMEAERYFVWLTGRKDLITKISFPAIEEKNLEIKLIETPNVDQELLSEYSQAEHTSWFNLLSGWQKICIGKEKEKLCASSIPSSLRSIPGLANSAYHTCQINNELSLSFFRSATQLPIDLLGNKKTVEEQFRLTCLNLASQIRVSIARKANALGSIPELIILTQSILSPGLIASLKAKLLTSASDNDTQIYNSKEKAVKLFQYALNNPDAFIQDAKIKSIFFTSEDQQKDLYYKDLLEKYGLITQKNKTYKYGENKLVKLTLLSTNHPYNILRHFGTYTPQTAHNEFNTALLLGAIARYLTPLLLKTTKQNVSEWQPERWTLLEKDLKFSCFSAKLNKLINELNCCEKSQNLSDNSRKSLAQTLENFVNFVKEQDLNKDVEKKFLEENDLQLLDALQTLLSIPDGQGVLSIDKRHKQQLKSIAEIIIIERMGGAAWVACKSGKDRTGGAANAIDAAAIYYAQHKKFPRFDDDRPYRELYLEALKKCHESGHQQKAASENATGAQGLVKSSSFYPYDLKRKANNRNETNSARLNKPAQQKREPKNFFNVRNYKEELQQIINRMPGENKHDTFLDWNRHIDAYYIDGISIKKLREVEVDGKLISKPFSDQNDLSKFIEDHLLQHVEDSNLKKYYLALVLQSFRSAQFPHAFAIRAMQLINKKLREKKAIIEQPQMCINFSYKEDSASIQIEEINTFKNKRYYKIGNQEQISRENEEGDYCQTHSSFILKLIKRGKGYKLATMDEAVRVTYVDELKDIFLKKFSYLEAIWDFLLATIAAIKQYFDELIRSVNVLDEKWLIKVKTPTKRGGKEVRSQEPRDRDGCALTDKAENALPSKARSNSSSDFFKPIREREDSNKTTPQPSSSNTISYT